MYTAHHAISDMNYNTVTASMIATDPQYARSYARDILKGRFPEAEPVIAKDPRAACLYAQFSVRGRFPDGEHVISKDPHYAFTYAKYVIKGRWPEAEANIAKSIFKDLYFEAFPEARDDWAFNGWIDWLDA